MAQASEEESGLDELLAYIEDERDRRRAAIRADAREQAAAIRRDALREARRRVRERIRREREALAERIRAARAAEESTIRARQHKLARDWIARAWQRLEDRLHERWQDPETRAQWLAAALDTAARHLPDGTWRVEHPPEPQPPADAEDSLAQRRPGVELEWHPDPDVAAGVRIRAGRASLDMTDSALLARSERIEGLLLGALIEHAGSPYEPPRTGEEP